VAFGTTVDKKAALLLRHNDIVSLPQISHNLLDGGRRNRDFSGGYQYRRKSSSNSSVDLVNAFVVPGRALSKPSAPLRVTSEAVAALDTEARPRTYSASNMLVGAGFSFEIRSASFQSSASHSSRRFYRLAALASRGLTHNTSASKGVAGSWDGP